MKRLFYFTLISILFYSCTIRVQKKALELEGFFPKCPFPRTCSNEMTISEEYLHFGSNPSYDNENSHLNEEEIPFDPNDLDPLPRPWWQNIWD